MSEAHEAFTLTAPPLTPSPTGILIPTNLPPSVVRNVAVVIPASPLCGLALAYAKQQVIPRTAGNFIVGSTSALWLTFDLSKFGTSGQWGAIVYNTGNIAQVFTLYYAFDYLHVVRRSAPIAPLTDAALYTALSQ